MNKDGVIVDFEVYCALCGMGLCSHTRVSGKTIRIDPCPRCSHGIEFLKKRLELYEFETVAQMNKRIGNKDIST